MILIVFASKNYNEQIDEQGPDHITTVDARSFAPKKGDEIAYVIEKGGGVMRRDLAIEEDNPFAPCVNDGRLGRGIEWSRRSAWPALGPHDYQPREPGRSRASHAQDPRQIP